MEIKQPQSHSAAYLGEHRNFWWNPDFMELMAKRWGLHTIHSVLDVGCGIGHWGQELSRFLPNDAKITGVDREAEWVQKASERTKEQKGRFHYQQSPAETMPFADNTFDLVTCQTVLLHVHDVTKVLNEMVRVLKPGGLLIVAEPNNTIAELVFDTCSYKEPVEDSIRAISFNLRCEWGQQKLGLGFSSMGDVMPSYFQKMHLSDIQVYLSDKTTPLIPPYEGEEQQAFITLMQEWVDAELFIWDKAETKKYFLAGGGEPETFEGHWAFFKKRFQDRLKAIENKTYSTSGGCLLYLISGRKGT
jgi:ubiquinone/menaquinone biosynthesis C-methylase UbiE